MSEQKEPRQAHREAIAAAINPGSPKEGTAALERLEAAGYRVLPLAAVPKVSSLAYTSERLGSVAALLLRPVEGAPTNADVDSTAKHIDRLVRLACEVLKVNRVALADIEGETP